MKVIIAGGRDYLMTQEDWRWLDKQRSLIPITEVVSGGATGADAGGEAWAESREVPIKREPAKWADLTAPGAVIKYRRDGTAYNAKAGYDRNMVMACYAEALIIFPGGKGTLNMIRCAHQKGLPMFSRPCI